MTVNEPQLLSFLFTFNCCVILCYVRVMRLCLLFFSEFLLLLVGGGLRPTFERVPLKSMLHTTANPLDII